jgi:translation initiation factor IF-3
MKEFRISDPRTNDKIRVPEVRLVGPNGEQIGVVSIDVALRMAQEADLDLVEVAPNSKPPVAKIMDYGKFKYEEAQKAKEARRNQANTILKEVRFRLKIDVHDYETKRKRAEGFLAAGDKVKAMILFRGREQSRPDQGVRLLQRFAEDVSEFGAIESTPMIDGRNMVMVIGPHKTKATAKAEADAKRSSGKPARDSDSDVDSERSTTADSDDSAASTPAKAAPKAPAAKVVAPKAVKAAAAAHIEMVEDTFVKAPRVAKVAPVRSAPPRSAPASAPTASSASESSASASSASASSASASAPASAPAADTASAPAKVATSAPKSAPPASTPKAAVAPRPPLPVASAAASATASMAAKVMAAKAAPKKPASAETPAVKEPKKEDKDA